MSEPTALKTCPQCRCDDYTFRGRKHLPPGPDGGASAVETKYRCKGCGREWKVRSAAA